jgi:hypothetical protein
LHAVIVHVIRRRFGPEHAIIADVLFDEAILVMAAHHWIGKVDIFDNGLKLATVLLRDLAAEDDRELIRLSDGAIGIQQSIADAIQRRPAREDEIVAIFNLSKKQLVLNTPLLSFSWCEERRQASQPLVTDSDRSPEAQGNPPVLVAALGENTA